METYDVGRMRYCPACAKPLTKPFDIGLNDPSPEDFHCSGCLRPSHLCPCAAAED